MNREIPSDLRGRFVDALLLRVLEAQVRAELQLPRLLDLMRQTHAVHLVPLAVPVVMLAR
ncbi:MAG: hypothetical protein ACTHL8_05380 [Burkholderiaceae bacterium]